MSTTNTSWLAQLNLSLAQLSPSLYYILVYFPGFFLLFLIFFHLLSIMFSRFTASLHCWLVTVFLKCWMSVISGILFMLLKIFPSLFSSLTSICNFFTFLLFSHGLLCGRSRMLLCYNLCIHFFHAFLSCDLLVLVYCSYCINT